MTEKLPPATVLASVPHSAEISARLIKTFTHLIDEMDIAMWELDLNYRVIAFNRKARQIYGEKALGDFCYHAAACLESVCPDCPAKEVYEGASSGRSEHRRVDASGNIIFIDHIATPIRDGDGALTGALVLIIDITPRKLLEAELTRHRDRLEELVSARTQALKESETRYRQLYRTAKQSEELYRSLLSSSADAIVVYDMDGLAQYINPTFTEIFGWTDQELIGKRIPYLPESERESSMVIIGNLIRNGTPCHGFETRRLTKDGRLLDISLSASRYHDHHGDPAGMLVILRDVTEKRQLETRLKHSERMEAIGRLAGGVAHDFNNLMMGIMGNVSLMQMDLDPSHPYAERLEKIETAIRSGAKLTSQLLGYARQGQYEIRPVDLNRIIQDAAEGFGRTRKDITVRFSPDESLPPAEADESQIQLALLNLFINAADAMPGGGDLRIETYATVGRHSGSAETPDKAAVIEITDTGTGIDESIIDRIFEPFFTTKKFGEGTGLGLASAYGIVQSHGGRIEVDSRKGRGTTFRIRLPLSEAPASRMDAASREIAGGSGTILLVDDEEMVLETGKEMLRRTGYSVLTADSGDEAVECFKRHAGAVDLVILDMILPGMGGGEIFDAIREIDPDIRVLLSSGYSFNGQASDIMRRGCSGFLQKPFRLAELAAKVDEILRR